MQLTLLLAGLSMLGAFSIDTYFPSFPAIAEHFGVTLADMQKTLSFYLLALAMMSLFHGSLSDSFGRRKIILATLVVYIIGCVGSIFAPNFEALVFFRVLQGLTAGAGFIITQAIARDLHQGPEAQKLLAKIMMVFSIAPAVAPILGGYLHVWFGWQGPFLFLTLYGSAMLFLARSYLPETLPPSERHYFHPVILITNYIGVIRNLKFCLFAIVNGLMFSAIVVYVTAAPDFVMNILGLKETEFGWMFIPVVIGLVTGSFFSHRLADKVASDKLINIAYAIMAGAALLNVVYNYSFKPVVPWAVLPLGIYVIGSSLASPIIALKALDIFPNNRGLASSILSFATLIGFAAMSGFVAPHVLGSGLALASVMAVLVVANFIVYRLASLIEPRI